MERTKKATKDLTEEEKWIATANHIGRCIPFCEELKDFAEHWTDYRGGGTETIEEIKYNIKSKIRKWITNTPEPEVVEMAKHLNPLARQRLTEIMPIQFRGLFENRKGQFPIQLSCPIPFFPYEKRLGTLHLSKPIVIQQGEVTIRIRNVLCRADDIKVYVALNQIRKQKIALLDDNKRSIVILPTFTEIATELGKTNPGNEQVHAGIRRSLERLKDMSLTWEKGKGKNLKWYDSSLLHLTTNLDEDSGGCLEIHMDGFFLNWMQTQFNGIDNLEVFYALPGKQVNLFLFINRQMEFNRYGVLDFQVYKQDIKAVYKMASLHSPLGVQPNLSAIRKDFIALLNGLKNHGMIADYAIRNGYLVVSRDKALPALPKQKKALPEKEDDSKEIHHKPIQHICPHGHRIDIDSWQFPECDGCNLEEVCG